MTFNEFSKKHEKDIDKALKCKNMDEFKKLAIENGIDFTEEELKRAWSYVQSQTSGENDQLNDDALESVAGGISKTNTTTRTTTEIKQKVEVSVETDGGDFYGEIKH